MDQSSARPRVPFAEGAEPGLRIAEDEPLAAEVRSQLTALRS